MIWFADINFRMASASDIYGTMLQNAELNNHTHGSLCLRGTFISVKVYNITGALQTLVCTSFFIFKLKHFRVCYEYDRARVSGEKRAKRK